MQQWGQMSGWKCFTDKFWYLLVNLSVNLLNSLRRDQGHLSKTSGEEKMEIGKENKECNGYLEKREEDTHWQGIVLKTKSLVKIMNTVSKIWCFSLDTFKCLHGTSAG